MAYVYCHFKSDNNDPFYVGIGKTKTRPYTMYNRSKWHKNIVKKHGVKASIIINNIDWENACFWEKAWIKALKRDNYNIANLTDGGDGVKGLNFTEDHRKKLSDAKIGKKQSLETIKKRSEKLIGKKRSLETIEKVRLSNIGKKRTKEQNEANSLRTKKLMENPENRKKLSDANTGKKLSEETKLKISLYFKGKKLSEEHKLKIGLANKGKKSGLGLKRSDEIKRKMSESAKIREAKKRELRNN